MGIGNYDRWKTTDPNDTLENFRYSDLCSDYAQGDRRVDDAIRAAKFIEWLTQGYEEFYNNLTEELDSEWPVDEECQAAAYNELKDSYPW